MWLLGPGSASGTPGTGEPGKTAGRESKHSGTHSGPAGKRAGKPAKSPAGKRAGKVVRVERPRVVQKTELRFCPMQLGDGKTGTCYGGAPAPGDHAMLFDFEQNFLGELVVQTIEPSQSDLCGTGSAMDFTYELMPAAAGSSKQIPFGVAIFGVDMEPHKAELVTEHDRLPTPPGGSRAQPWMGLDSDGDGALELLVTAFECTDIAPPPSVAGKSSEAFCLDYWLSSAQGFTQVRRDFIHTCF